ncbi:hypothetical protein [Flexithrix dorotheae]|uniref:hypothetical protein n=1 Tax=Flexithrix dorotheae TaxID=70993 RepID=UPI00037A66AD|nr:hypothetical protein [Flexithrix dorotheae]
MRLFTFFLFFIFASFQITAQTVELNPENPHYLNYKNQPVILITSAEHYGAVLNLDFDYETYLKTLGDEGMNYTRIFTGVYVEEPGAFNIKNNTLAPKPNRVITPWKRSGTPGYANGGNKFDLDQWDEQYFNRLKDFLKTAEANNVIVEITFFSSIYRESGWEISPLHPENNVNGINHKDYKTVHTPDNGKKADYQQKMVSKIVKEVNEFDNIFFEIQNEPWSDQKATGYYINPFDKKSDQDWKRRVDLASEASLEWQKNIAAVVKETESTLPKKHIIAQNFCNFKYPLKEVEPNISIINFHYAWPDAVNWNYGYNKVLSYDESGFSGSEDDVYRKQAWNFIMSGGGIFNNLDYSFFAGKEDGSMVNEAPGGGSKNLRKELKVLKDFIGSFEFIRLKPDHTTIKFAPGVIAKTLSEPGKQYAIYLELGNSCELQLELPKGKYSTDWVNVTSGVIIKNEVLESRGKVVRLKSPEYEGAIALRIKK